MSIAILIFLIFVPFLVVSSYIILKELIVYKIKKIAKTKDLVILSIERTKETFTLEEKKDTPIVSFFKNYTMLDYGLNAYNDSYKEITYKTKKGVEEKEIILIKTLFFYPYKIYFYNDIKTNSL